MLIEKLKQHSYEFIWNGNGYSSCCKVGVLDNKLYVIDYEEDFVEVYNATQPDINQVLSNMVGYDQIQECDKLELSDLSEKDFIDLR